MHEGPHSRPFVHLRSGGDSELAVFDGDLDALTGLEAGVLDPSTASFIQG